MVEFDVPINKKQRVAYIPKVLVQSLGHHLRIVPNTRAAVMYPSDASIEQVLDSLQIIMQDLELKAKHLREKSTSK